MRIREECMGGEDGEVKKMRGEEDNKKRNELIGKKEEDGRQRKESGKV